MDVIIFANTNISNRIFVRIRESGVAFTLEISYFKANVAGGWENDSVLNGIDKS